MIYRGLTMDQAVGCAIKFERPFSWLDTRRLNTGLWANVRRWYPCVMEGME